MIALTSDLTVSSEVWDCLLATSILAIAALASAESRLWPSGAATTTRSADPFCPPNLALIRSVAFWTSEPGMLKSLTSVPWNATFSTISETKMTSQVPITRHGCRAQCPAQRASTPV